MAARQANGEEKRGVLFLLWRAVPGYNLLYSHQATPSVLYIQHDIAVYIDNVGGVVRVLYTLGLRREGDNGDYDIAVDDGVHDVGDGEYASDVGCATSYR